MTHYECVFVAAVGTSSTFRTACKSGGVSHSASYLQRIDRILDWYICKALRRAAFLDTRHAPADSGCRCAVRCITAFQSAALSLQS